MLSALKIVSVHRLGHGNTDGFYSCGFNPVLTKRDFSVRYAEGEFGNASPTWLTPNEFLATWNTAYPATVPSKEWRERFHLRNRVKGGPTFYNLYWSECIGKWLDMPDKTQWYVSEMAPHAFNLLQGEVQQTDQGLCLFYSTERYANMREALGERDCAICLKRNAMFFTDPMIKCWNCGSNHGSVGKVCYAKHAFRMQAQLLLQRNLCANSYDWMQELLNRYPGHVIEFSTFSRKWGTLPNFNTVFWEVRKY